MRTGLHDPAGCHGNTARSSFHVAGNVVRVPGQGKQRIQLRFKTFFPRHTVRSALSYHAAQRTTPARHWLRGTCSQAYRGLKFCIHSPFFSLPRIKGLDESNMFYSFLNGPSVSYNWPYAQLPGHLREGNNHRMNIPGFSERPLLPWFSTCGFGISGSEM